MTHTSLYGLIPPTALPQGNVFNLLHNREEQKEWDDYTLHIEPDTGKRTGHREWMSRVKDGATGLAGLGMDNSSMVGMLSPNCSDYISLMHSLLAITAPFALISSYSTPFELAHAFHTAQITHLFVHPSLLKAASKATKEFGLSRDKIFVLSGDAKGYKSFGQLVKAVKDSQTPRIAIRDASKDTLAYLVFSSGTSGLPKAVRISHGNIIFASMQMAVIGAHTAAVHTAPPLRTTEGIPVMLGFLPFHHTFGLHTFCLRQFLAQATVVIMPSWNINRGLSIVKKYKVSHIGLVPSIIHQIVHHPGITPSDLASLQYIGCGAAYLPPILLEQFKALLSTELSFGEGYGMSECTVGAIGRPQPGVLGGINVPLGSSGVLYPGMKGRIVDEAENDVQPGEIGELWLKGDNVALGYHQNDQATRQTFVDGWVKTGDRFKAKDNIFYFEDRAKDTLKISGMQVSPVEIEVMLLAHPDKLLSDCTVAGVSGGRTNDEKVPRAWVVLSETGRRRGQVAVKAALKDWVELNLSKYKHLRGGIEVVDAIPKSPTGKVLRRVLQDKHQAKLRSKL